MLPSVVAVQGMPRSQLATSCLPNVSEDLTTVCSLSGIAHSISSHRHIVVHRCDPHSGACNSESRSTGRLLSKVVGACH